MKLTFQVASFFPNWNWIRAHQENPLYAVFATLVGFARRFLHVIKAHNFDFIFIHREAAPIGPPFFEWLIAVVFKQKIIFDFDDAIWLTDKTYESSLERALRSRWKISKICSLAYKISCGNYYLIDFAKQFNNRVVHNPTCIDPRHHEPTPEKEFMMNETNKNIVIGWTGSRSTIKYLISLVPVLQLLERKFAFLNFLIIADSDPQLPLERARFLPWKLKTEIEDLQKIDIGIMPLPDDDWSKGKCGFKALQYMALEIPAVVSSVGANKDIVDHGVNGFLCSATTDWVTHLSELIVNPELRRALGKDARKKVIRSYSVPSNERAFLSLFT